MLVDSLTVDAASFQDRTGWAVKPEGLCRGEVCVPLPPGGCVGEGTGARLDLAVVADRLGMPIVQDAEHGLWALGPPTVSGRALTSAEAADLALPGRDGNPFRLSNLRGRKVLLVAWASW